MDAVAIRRCSNPSGTCRTIQCDLFGATLGQCRTGGPCAKSRHNNPVRETCHGTPGKGLDVRGRASWSETVACRKAHDNRGLRAGIQDVLIPRFLPQIRPHAEFNYPIGIHGKWLGNKYRFMTRYKSDAPNRIAEGFDAPFARLEYVSPDCFDLSWHRHTGTWHTVFQQLTLEDALHQLAESGIFVPC